MQISPVNFKPPVEFRRKGDLKEESIQMYMVVKT